MNTAQTRTLNWNIQWNDHRTSSRGSVTVNAATMDDAIDITRATQALSDCVSWIAQVTA